MEANRMLFPLFVDLQGKLAVVVGGGTVAARRTGALLRFGARVRVVAPRVKERLAGAEYVLRPYAPGDLTGADLAVAATDDRQGNAAAGEEARSLGIPVSVADAPGERTFFFPAICEGGELIAGMVSRNGDHRAVAGAARAVRRTLEEWK